ncbi:MAG TPA: DUF4388 domain-containing protein [Thermoleophilia bacterium]|nr:DUF4388 domain-containing protein [Thermoleophilia bacterium]
MPGEYTLRPLMQGTLDTFSVVEILQMLARTRSSGTLHIECPNRQVDVHFVGGRIAETRDSTRVFTDSVLGSQLLKRALVNEAQLKETLAVQERSPRPLGTLLVERGHLHERDLREVLSRQVANTLVAVKVETAGSFVFVADKAARPVDFVTIDTHAVLMDISSLGGDYCLAVEVLGQANTVLVRNRDYDTLPRHSLSMGRDEFYVLAQVDDHRTVREITAATSLEEITVVSILGVLAEAGVLLVKAEKQTRAEDDQELKAHRDSVWAEVSALLDDLAGGDAASACGDAASPPA